MVQFILGADAVTSITASSWHPSLLHGAADGSAGSSERVCAALRRGSI